MESTLEHIVDRKRLRKGFSMPVSPGIEKGYSFSANSASLR
jgi:hypothetical protein